MRRPPNTAVAYVLLLAVLAIGHVLVQRSHLYQLEGLERGFGGKGGRRATQDLASVARQVEVLLNITVPVLLDKSSLAPKQAGVGFSCGESHVVKLKGYGELQRARNLSKVLPDVDVFSGSEGGRSKAFDNCAVVGNSGTLLESEFGNDIDSHDVVFRFNQGITEGYEPHVGKKTTFRILNKHQSGAAVEVGEKTISTIREMGQLRAWVRSTLEHPRRAALVFDPEFLCYCWSWVGRRGHKPSSGLVGIVLALKSCHSTTIFGFSSSSYYNSEERPHYYDWERPAKGRERVHPFQYEQKLYHHLHDLGYLSIRS